MTRRRRLRYVSDLFTPWALVAFSFGILLGVVIFGLTSR